MNTEARPSVANSPTPFIVTDLSADAEMYRATGGVSTAIHKYTATLRSEGLQIGSDGEGGECEISISRTRRPFPWTIGQKVQIPIPWGGC